MTSVTEIAATYDALVVRARLTFLLEAVPVIVSPLVAVRFVTKLFVMEVTVSCTRMLLVADGKRPVGELAVNDNVPAGLETCSCRSDKCP